jgi:AcrR family transcriptional regulator
MTSTVATKGGMNDAARGIARVAARLFATQGYEATSVRTIVEEAGVTKPTLYYHFGSKEGLAQAVLILPMSLLAEKMRMILETRGDPIEALVRIVEAHFDFCREDADAARFFFALAFGPRNSELMRQVKGAMEALPELMIEGIRRLADAGIIAPERIDAFAMSCRGMIVITMMDYLYHGRHPDCVPDWLDSNGNFRPGLADRLVGDLLHGFALPGAMDRGIRP